MKTVSENGDYIDYTHVNSGVRVWKNQCQAIIRQDETCDWVGREDHFPIPVQDSILGFPIPEALRLRHSRSRLLSLMKKSAIQS
jgi:hypothetical protein